jgi:hypothetical protein
VCVHPSVTMSLNTPVVRTESPNVWGVMSFMMSSFTTRKSASRDARVSAATAVELLLPLELVNRTLTTGAPDLIRGGHVCVCIAVSVDHACYCGS